MKIFGKVDFTNMLVLVVAVVIAIFVAPTVKSILPSTWQAKINQ